MKSVKPQKPGDMVLRLMRVAEILVKGERDGEYDPAFPSAGLPGEESSDRYSASI